MKTQQSNKGDRFWSPLTRQLHPYVPGEQPQHDRLVKLNTNESPYPPSPQVIQAIQAVTADELPRYPDPAARALREAIARRHALDANQVFVGNGSDEVLSHVFMGLIKRDQGQLLFPDISYSFYPVWCQLHGIAYETVPLRDDFSIDVMDYDTNANAVIIPNPNAPTGRLLGLASIEQLLQAAPDRLLVVDEAYIDFGGDSASCLLNTYDNLLVIQTLSKSRALAGLRVGLALGSVGLIEALERIKDSFNSYPLGVVAQRAAAAAFDDNEYVEGICARVVASRQALAAALESRGFEVTPSAANFLFLKHPAYSGKGLFDGLREKGVILRRWDKPRISEYLRVSIGTEDQCQILLDELDAVMAALDKH